MEGIPRKDFLANTHVFAGVKAAHSFLLAQDGNLYAIGRNNKGQLSLGDTLNRRVLVLIPLFSSDDKRIQQAAGGALHSLFLTTKRQVFASGSNRHGQLGLGDKKPRIVAESIPELENENIVDIACSADSSYCLTDDGRLFGFGWNRYGQIGDGTEIDKKIPILINFPGESGAVLSVSAGFYHVAALTSNGKCHTWGSNYYGQLGRDGMSREPACVIGLPNEMPVRQIICGGSRTTVLFSPTKVYSFGRNFSGRLGIGNTENQPSPVRVEFFDNHGVKTFSSGGDHTVSILENGEIFVYGLNYNNQLCLGDDSFKKTPTQMPISKIGESKIIDIVCGGDYTLLVTANGSCYGVGGGKSFGRGFGCHSLPGYLELCINCKEDTLDCAEGNESDSYEISTDESFDEAAEYQTEDDEDETSDF